MKRTAIVILSMVTLFAQTVVANPKNQYRAELEAIVDNYIGAFEAGAGLIESKNKSVREGAVLSYLKATFFRLWKHSLLDELMANKVVAEPYKVQCFLDSRFNEIVQEKKTELRKDPCPWDRHGYFK